MLGYKNFIYTWYKTHVIYVMYRYFLSFCGLSFDFLDSFFWCTKVFNFDEVHFIFYLVACAVGAILRNHCLIQVHKDFFLNFILYIFLYSRFLLVIHFIHISVYMSIPVSQFITHTHPCHFPTLVSIRLFSISVSLFLPCKPVHLYHFSRFHIYVLIYDICFSLSDLLHSVWQSLDPSTSQQMTQIRSFLWLSNIALYICTTTSLSIRLSMGI